MLTAAASCQRSSGDRPGPFRAVIYRQGS